MTVADGNPAVPGGAMPPDRCYRHPNREALVRCTRCDRPICPDCMRPASVGFHCPDDVALARKTVRAPRTSVGATLRHSPAYVTYSLIAANIAIYLISVQQYQHGFGPNLAPAHDTLFFNWDMFPQTVHDKSQYYRLITSAFLHVSLLHVASNMLALFVIGPSLERLLGRWRFVAVYLAGALAGSTAIYALGDKLTPVVGASGAIFGLFAASLVLVRRLGLDLQWLIGIVVLNFVLTFSISGISKLGHIGGFIGGGLAALAIAGLPSRGERFSVERQLLGLGAVAALILIVVAARSATF